MNRIRDYLNFSISFSGLGYIWMWPLSTPDAYGRLFGADLICRDGGFVLLDVVCGLPHPLQMSPALHLLGLLAAAYVAVRLSWRALRAALRARARRHRNAALDAALVAARLPAVIAPPSASEPPQPLLSNLPPVGPRAQFGLRSLQP